MRDHVDFISSFFNVRRVELSVTFGAASVVAFIFVDISLCLIIFLYSLFSTCEPSLSSAVFVLQTQSSIFLSSAGFVFAVMA